VQGKLLGAVKAMYGNSRACVRMNGATSNTFSISSGVRQGCVMSPWLFNVFMDACMRRATDDSLGVKVGSMNVCRLLYADDSVLLAESSTDLQKLVDLVSGACKEMHLSVNVPKTKVVVFEKGENVTECKIQIDGQWLDQVNEFVYLGSLFHRDGSLDGEIERRVNACLRVVGATGKICRDQDIDMKCKLAVYESVLIPTLTYGSETWVMLKKHNSRIVAGEMRFLRGMCGKSRRDLIRNVDIKSMCGVQRDACDHIRQSMLRWFGHVERMKDERLTKAIYSGNVEGKRGRGRPKKVWLEQIADHLKERDVKSMNVRRACINRVMDVCEAKNVCKDRDTWRRIVHT
jgi:hypothetical protein